MQIQVSESAVGKVVGDNRPNADLSSNTTNNVTVNVYTVENNIATVGTANGVNYALSQKDIQLYLLKM